MRVLKLKWWLLGQIDCRPNIQNGLRDVMAVRFPLPDVLPDVARGLKTISAQATASCLMIGSLSPSISGIIGIGTS